MKKDPVYYHSYLLPEDGVYKSYHTENSREIGSFSQINLFIGPNNSGKSRFLRALFNEKPLPYTTSKYDAYTFSRIAFEGAEILKNSFGPSISSLGSISNEFLDSVSYNVPKHIDPQSSIIDLVEERLSTLSKISESDILKQTLSVSGAETTIRRNMVAKFSEIVSKCTNDLNKLEIERLGNEKKFYIPILRGLRALRSEGISQPLQQSSQIFYEVTLLDYFSKSRRTETLGPLSDNCYLFTGETMYKKLKEMLLSEPDKRKRVKEYEDYLSKYFFNGESITLIPREADDIVHVLIGGDQQLPIYDLGDGLQTLLICTFNAFMETDRCLFYIEEPDTYMHPGMQRALIEALQENPQHQYYITTHSNHFLDMTLDFSNVSVFRFQKTVHGKNPEFSISEISSPDANILRDLGVLNSSVFLTNATIWVEGITDRLYLRAFLNKYITTLEAENPEMFEKYSLLHEDTHYSFVEYQGSTLIHWTFDPNDDSLKRIKANWLCGGAIMIADGDIANKKHGDRVKFYKECLGKHFILLPCKEIENLLPVEILRRIVNNRLKNRELDLSIVQFAEYSKLKSGLGAYLDRKLDLKNGEVHFATPSGTLRGKTRFCEDSVRLMENDELQWKLPTIVERLCQRILDYIWEMNTTRKSNP